MPVEVVARRARQRCRARARGAARPRGRMRRAGARRGAGGRRGGAIDADGGLGGMRGRRAADRGDVVDQRPVDVVPDGADDRHRQQRDRAAQGLIAERPQVGDRAAAARNDDHIDLTGRGQVGDGRADRGRGPLVLHRRVAPHDPAVPGAALESREEIAPCGAALGRDHADRARKQRQRELLLRLEQPLRGELAPQAVELHQQVALAGEPQVDDTEREAGRSVRATRVVVGPAGGDHLHAVAAGPPGACRCARTRSATSRTRIAPSASRSSK